MVGRLLSGVEASPSIPVRIVMGAILIDSMTVWREVGSNQPRYSLAFWTERHDECARLKGTYNAWFSCGSAEPGEGVPSLRHVPDVNKLLPRQRGGRLI